MVRAPSPGKSRALQARLRPTMRPFPSPKLGRVPLSSEGASRKGVALRLPSPMSHPARSRVGHPLVPCMIVLFCSFFFFFFPQTLPASPRPGTHPPLRPARGSASAALGPAPLYPQRPGSLRTPRSRLASGDRGDVEGAPEPGPSPLRPRPLPLPPQGPGTGGLGQCGALRLPWRDQGSRNQGSGIRPGARGEAGGE